ncbi:MAG: sodium:solute symporter [Christensenella sp.]|nr:sodium:solute symporter [Christensenella sp.]
MSVLLASSTSRVVVNVLMMLLFFGLMIAIGVICRKKATNVNGFVLGGRSVGPWLTAFAYGTSYFSAVIFIGYAGQFGYLFGVSSTWVGIGNAIIGSLLAWVVLGRRTRIMTQKLDSKTMSDFFGKRFDSTALKVAAAIIVFIFLIPYTASLFNGLSRLFTVAFGFTNENLAYIIIVCIMALLTAVYVTVGGYMATAVNDFIQGFIMIIGIVAVIGAVLSSQGGLTAAMQSMATSPEIGWEYTSFFGPMPVFLLFVVILTSLGTWGLPQMVGKFYAIKSEEDIKKGTIISTIFALIVAGGCYFLGGFGRLFVSNTKDFDSIIPTMLEKAVTSDLLMALIVILVLSASMSTLSSLVLTSSSTLTLDLIKGRLVKEENMTDKKQVFIMRIFIAVFIVISALIAIIQKVYNFSEIASLMGISWGALAGAFLAPFLFGLYWKKTTKSSVWTSFVVGLSIMIFSLIYKLAGWNFLTVTLSSGEKLNLANAVVAGAIAMLVNLIIVPIVSLITYKFETKKNILDKEKVDSIFDCYNKKVVVDAKVALDSASENN